MSPRPSMAKLLASSPFSSKSWGNTTGGRESRTIISCCHIKPKPLCLSWALTRLSSSGRSNTVKAWEAWNLHLIGASKDLATVTMTLVPNTYRGRQKQTQWDIWKVWALMPRLSKSLEKLVYVRFLNVNDILYKHQYGFRKKALDLYGPCPTFFSIGIFLDLSKPFDTVDHKILLSKLNRYGFHDVVISWFRDCLDNRQQYVCIEGVNSSKIEIYYGVPQGSVLVPGCTRGLNVQMSLHMFRW